MKITRSKVLLVAVLALVIAIGALLGRSTSVFVCRHCGATARDSDWQIPFTTVTVIDGSSYTEPTPLSTTLTSLGVLAAPAAHDWVLVHTVGNGLMCGLGSGGSTWLVARSERVAHLIRAAHTFGETGFRDRLIRCVFQRETAYEVELVAASAPLTALRDPAAFADWKRDTAVATEKLLSRGAR